MAATFELMRAAMPTRDDKRVVQRQLGYKNDSLIYKWCEDPGKSGRPNLVDNVDVVLDHARLHYPDAAIAIIQHFEAGNVRVLTRRAGQTPIPQLISTLQPGVEKEALESVSAFSSAFRQIIASGRCDLHAVLKEVEESERQARAAASIIRAAIVAEEARSA
jgi:hypothetical protein